MAIVMCRLKFVPGVCWCFITDAKTIVDANGRVQDYRIISGPKDAAEYTNQLDKVMIFTTFRPATSFGRPTVGRAVLSFSKINVKG